MTVPTISACDHRLKSVPDHLNVDGAIELSSSEKVRIEAEDIEDLGAPWEVVAQSDASGGKMIQVSSWSGTIHYTADGIDSSYPATAIQTLSLNVETDGEYTLTMRTFCEDGNSDSIFWRPASDRSWNVVHLPNGEGRTSTLGTYFLTKGLHTPQFTFREMNTGIDYIEVEYNADNALTAQSVKRYQPNQMIVGSLWQTASSNGATIIQFPTRDGSSVDTRPPSAFLTIPLNVKDQGMYDFKMRTHCPDGASNSIFWRIDDGEWSVKQFAKVMGLTQSIDRMFLNAGFHKVEITYREPNTGIEFAEFSYDTPILSSSRTATFEAESGGLIGPGWDIVDQQDASGGKMIQRSSKDGDNVAKYILQVDTAGNYNFQAGVFFANGQSDSFYWSIDGGALVTQNQDRSRLITVASIPLDRGEHILELIPREANSGIDFLRFTYSGEARYLWTDSSVPPSFADVTIPAGVEVQMQEGFKAKSLTVAGTLRCGEGNDLFITTNFIHVTGRFECGSFTKPFEHKMTITLLGDESDSNINGMGAKFIGTSGSGVLELHGKPVGSTTWTHLSRSEEVGSSEIQTSDITGWSVGDEIAIAPSRLDCRETELRVIVGIQGNTIQLDRSLEFYHHGEIERHSNGNREWVLDERAEVGNLSRKFVIQGDKQSTQTKFGGHLMFQNHGRISNIRLHRMGQKGRLGRYPVHWHMLGDARGQFAKGCVVVDSFNRAFTIHGTDRVTLQDNVAYNIPGHAYFLEDGAERFNVIDHNLGLMNVRPAEADAILETDTRDIDDRTGEQSTSAGPATFWITHPENTVTNNAAAGGEGSGFWYFTEPTPSGASSGRTDIRPRTDPMGSGSFKNNKAHSSQFGFTSCPTIAGFIGQNGPAVYEHFTSYHTQIGAWPCNGDVDTDRNHMGFNELIVADSSRRGMQSPNPNWINDSLFVGFSKNSDGKAAHGIALYDSGYKMNTIHFANFDQNGSPFATRSSLLGRSGNRIRGASFDNVPRKLGSFATSLSSLPNFAAVVVDLDGSLSGYAGHTIVSEQPIMYDETCKKIQGSTYGYACPYHYARVRIVFGGRSTFTLTRSDGAVHRRNFSRVNPNVITGSKYTYKIENDSAWNSNRTIQLHFARNGDTTQLILSKCQGRRISGATRMSSAAQVWQSKSNAWYLDGSGNMHLKLVATGKDYEAQASVEMS